MNEGGACIIVGYLVMGMVCAMGGSAISERKGHGELLGGVIGFFLGPVGLLILAMLPMTAEAEAKRQIEIDATKRRIIEGNSPEAAARREAEEKARRARERENWEMQQKAEAQRREVEAREREERNKKRREEAAAREARKKSAREAEIARAAMEKAARDAEREAKHRSRWVSVVCPRCGETIRVQANAPSVCWSCQAELDAIEK